MFRRAFIGEQDVPGGIGNDDGILGILEEVFPPTGLSGEQGEVGGSTGAPERAGGHGA
jgi:hypothetical protein